MRSDSESAENPPEHHRVGRADASARQHRHRQLGDHRHVDAHAVAALHAEALQHIGELAHLVEQVGVGDGAGVAGLALPPVGHLVAAAGLDVAVEAVVRHVERAAQEPLRERQVPLEHGVEVGEPGDVLAGLARPERQPVRRGLVVERPVCGQRRRAEAVRGLEDAVFDVVVLDRRLGARAVRWCRGHRCPCLVVQAVCECGSGQRRVRSPALLSQIRRVVGLSPTPHGRAGQPAG